MHTSVDDISRVHLVICRTRQALGQEEVSCWKSDIDLESDLLSLSL